MKRFILFMVLTMYITGMFYSVPVQAQGYQLATGDVIALDVWGFEELQVKEAIIRPDGKVSLPLVGESMAAGLTIEEFSARLSTGFAEYIKVPKVAVNVVKFHTTRVYVLGEISKPGMYEIERQHNLLDAIGAAGGYTKDAAKKKVSIIRNAQTKEPEIINLFDILKKGDMGKNVTLRDGDVVFLSGNGKVNFAADVLPWISATYQVKRMNESVK